MFSSRWNSLKRASRTRQSLDIFQNIVLIRKTCNHLFSISGIRFSDHRAQRLEEVDVLSFERLFGYTWLTHLKLLEEDSAFRQQVIEMRINKRLGRSNYLKNGADSQDCFIEHSLCPDQECQRQSFPTMEEGDREDLEWISAQNEVMNNEKVTSNEEGIKVLLGGQELSVSPLWISVRVDGQTKRSSVFESIIPIEEQTVQNIGEDLIPFFESDELVFEEQAEFKSGPWRNYFIGIVGEVSVTEDGNLWPNQVLHKDRCLYNVRNASDLVKFLADPTKEDIENHLGNLERLAQERDYKRGWCWYMLKTRWGQRALDKYGIVSRDSIS